MANSVMRTAAPIKEFISEDALIKSFTTEQPFLILGLEFLLAFPLGLLFSRLQIGSLAWILAGLLAGGSIVSAWRRLFQQVPQPNRTARKVGLSLVGMTIGFSITQGELAHATTNLPVYVLLTVFMLLSGSAIGFVYARLSRTNLLTAMLATVPGGVGVMASLAADYGRNVTQVALVQIIRVTAVILGIPLLAGIISGSGLNPRALAAPRAWLSLEPINLGLLTLALGGMGLAVYLADRLKIPAAPFLGAVVVGTVFNPLLHQVPGMTHLSFSPPLLVSVIGQILLGLTIGEYWGSHCQKGAILSKRSLAGAFISVFLTLATGMVAATIAMLITSWDWLTCLLVTAPGGAPEMILVALTLHHQVETVTAAHLVRLIAINGSLPLWILLFNRLEQAVE